MAFISWCVEVLIINRSDSRASREEPSERVSAVLMCFLTVLAHVGLSQGFPAWFLVLSFSSGAAAGILFLSLLHHFPFPHTRGHYLDLNELKDKLLSTVFIGSNQRFLCHV